MIGKTLSHFKILAKIGEGGMGVVYRAEDEKLRRHVALKVLPPELVANEERRLRFLREARLVDVRSDLFSFGTTLYEMVTGKLAFQGKTATDTLSSIIRDEPTPPSQLNDTVPQELDRIVGRCLEKDPGERYQDTRDLVVELRKLKRATDSGVQAVRTPEAGIPSTTERVSARRTAKRLWGAVAVATAGAVFLAVFLWPPAPLRVTGYTQLTRSQVLFPPYASPFPLVTDGSRIYFDEWRSGGFEWRQMPVTGGEMVSFASPFPANRGSSFLDVTPDRSRLVVLVGEPEPGEGAFWLVPVVGGSPRRLGELVGHTSTWSPDGSQILYVNGSDLYLARSDGTEPLKLLTAPGRSYWPRFSPDGSRIRFSTFDPKSGLFNLWEASADGTDLHPLLPGWNDPPNQCCGSWTPDGTYYVFEATRENRSHIWAIREKGGLFGKSRSEPIQLTTGATHFIRPTIASDGKRIFAISWQLRGELVRYNAESGQFVPYLSSLSAEWLDFSKDGEWVTYVTYPEADLWRSRANGTERLQLTFPPMRASAPDWAADGETIAFEGILPGQHWKIYLVPADGGTPRPLTPEDRYEDSPTWSPDGNSLAFALRGGGGVHIFDLESGQASVLAGSEGVRGPNWSPDGRYLAAHSTDHTRLLLYDFATQRWAELVQTAVRNHYWSRDGQYLYFDTRRPGFRVDSVSRLRLRDRALEQIVGLGDIRQVWGLGGLWVGLAPDGSPLLLRDLSIHHIYALELEP